MGARASLEDPGLLSHRGGISYLDSMPVDPAMSQPMNRYPHRAWHLPNGTDSWVVCGFVLPAPQTAPAVPSSGPELTICIPAG